MPQNAANFKSTPLVDVRPFGLDGRIAADWLEQVGLTINKNALPFDPLPPSAPSGIRLGTPAATARGFGIAQFEAVGHILPNLLDAARGGVRRMPPCWIAPGRRCGR